MEWLNNANSIASLVLAIFGIGGYIFGIATYLKKKASDPLQETKPSQSSTPQVKASSIPHKPISWLEWTEIFAR